MFTPFTGVGTHFGCSWGRWVEGCSGWGCPIGRIAAGDFLGNLDGQWKFGSKFWDLGIGEDQSFRRIRESNNQITKGAVGFGRGNGPFFAILGG